MRAHEGGTLAPCGTGPLLETVAYHESVSHISRRYTNSILVLNSSDVHLSPA